MNADEPQTQTNWVTDITTDQLVLGIVIGLFLSVVVAIITNWLDMRRKRRIVAALCQDLIWNVCDLIKNLEDNRDRTRVIDHEFLNTIAAEIDVYARNREHLVLVDDADLRKDIREFFNRVSALLAQIQWRLRQFVDADQFAQRADTVAQKEQLIAVGEVERAAAHKVCDRLREMGARRDGLDGRLKRFRNRFL